MARPTKYTAEYCIKEMEAFQKILDEDEKYKYITWRDFVKDRPYSIQRVSEWKKKYGEATVKDNAGNESENENYSEEFSEAVNKIDDELKNRLIKLGLAYKAHASLVMFILKNNYGMTEKTEIDANIKAPELPNIIIKCAK